MTSHVLAEPCECRGRSDEHGWYYTHDGRGKIPCPGCVERLRRRAALCRSWLIRHDPEARMFWRSMPPGTDFAAAVLDNLRDFGPDDTGQADFALEVLR